MYYQQKGLMENRLVKSAVYGGIAAIIAYAGDGIDFREVVLHATHPGAKVAEGYYNPYAVYKVVKYEDGTVKGYLVDKKSKLPLLQGVQGVQAGSTDYVWGNLSLQDQSKLAEAGWDKLSNGKKVELFKKDLESAISDIFEGLRQRLGM